MMFHPFFLILLVGLVYWSFRGKSKGTACCDERPRRVTTIISGDQVQAFLDMDTPQKCLNDDGLRFGRSFELKQGPELPHSPDCRCVIEPFAYSTGQLFGTTSRLDSSGRRLSFVGELNASDARIFKEALIQLHQLPLGISFAEYGLKVHLSDLSESVAQKSVLF